MLRIDAAFKKFELKKCGIMASIQLLRFLKSIEKQAVIMDHHK